MSGALCLKCGQFRSPEELEAMARLIRAGTAIPFDDRELAVAATIGTWNKLANLGLLLAASLTSVVAVDLIAGLPIGPIVALGSAFVAAAVIAFALLKTVDAGIREARPTAGGTEAH